MKRYIKDGRILTRQDIVIVKNAMRTINPTEEQILADGWEVYVPLANTISEEKREQAVLIRARQKLRNNIILYDSSEEVNSFFLNSSKIWLDKATRAGLMLRFQAEQAMGNEYTTLWYGANQYSLPIGMAMQMLLAIEIYASECYDNTQRHLAEVDKLETKEEIEAYDYRVGYPEKLEF